MKKLFGAIERQDVGEVKKLVDRDDFNPHATEKHGAGYMFMAAHAGNVEIGQILRDAGVPISLEEIDGLQLDVLDYGRKHPNFLAFLAENGIDLGRVKPREGRKGTIIRTCALEGLVDTVEFLVNHGVMPTEDDVKYARSMLNYMSGGVSTPISSLVEAAVVAAGGLTKEEHQKTLEPYERIVDVLENVPVREQNAADTTIPLKDVDPKFRKGPKGKQTRSGKGSKGRLKV